jgi:hypothetical protein
MKSAPRARRVERKRPFLTIASDPIAIGRDIDALMLHDPDRFNSLLRAYHEMLGDHVVGALDAIHRAECEQQVPAAALGSSSVRALFAIVTLPKVVAERQRLDRVRDVHNRRAALLWAWSLDGVSA